MAGDEIGVLKGSDPNGDIDIIGYEALTPLPPNLPRSDGFLDALLAQLGVSLFW